GQGISDSRRGPGAARDLERAACPGPADLSRGYRLCPHGADHVAEGELDGRTGGFAVVDESQRRPQHRKRLQAVDEAFGESDVDPSDLGGDAARTRRIRGGPTPEP